MKSYLAATALVLLFGAGPGLAQTTTGAPAAPTSFITQQPAGEWLVSRLHGQSVTGADGELIGDINDLLFDRGGRVTGAVLGIGGFLGVGERNVAVPFEALVFSTGKNGERVVTVSLSKEELAKAPEFKPIEKSPYMKAKEQAGELGRKAAEKAGELKDRALEKIEEMRKSEPKTK